MILPVDSLADAAGALTSPSRALCGVVVLLFRRCDVQQGQLGQPHRNTVLRPMRVDALQNVPIVQVSAGGIHSAAVARTGELYTWGENSYGQLGRESGDALGPGLVTIQAEHGGAKPFLAIGVACGGMHTAALQEDGSVWCWGRGDSGQVGEWTFVASLALPNR